MPLTKCPKCGEEYDPFYTSHECKKEEEEKREKAEEKWKHKSAIAKFFTFPPGIPLPLKILAILCALGAFGGLLGILALAVLLFAKIIEFPLFVVGFIYAILIFLFDIVFFYGIGHMKKWAFYSYGGLLLFVFILTLLRKSFGAAISASIVPAVIFLILWAYRDNFLKKNKINL